MESPLSNLCEVLKQVKFAALSYPAQRLNEATTRTVLIDPILQALGWNVSDPSLVELERPITSGTLSGRLDYLLNTDNSEKPIVIEAKKLGEPLEKFFPQIITYACTLKIENLFLTDGLKWFHFSEVSASNHTPTGDIDLGKAEGADLTKAAAFFVERLDVALYALETQKVEDKLQEKIDSITSQLTEIQRQFSILADSMGKTIEIEPASLTNPETWLLFDGTWNAKKKKPARLRLPDGHIIDLKSWTQLLLEACKFCIKNNTNLLSQLPIDDRTGRATKLISTTKPPSNLNSDSFTIGDTTLHVYTNYSANDCVANAGYMFAKLKDMAVKPALLLAD
jgi:predicted type IV restriction endonuclease